MSEIWSSKCFLQDNQNEKALVKSLNVLNSSRSVIYWVKILIVTRGQPNVFIWRFKAGAQPLICTTGWPSAFLNAHLHPQWQHFTPVPAGDISELTDLCERGQQHPERDLKRDLNPRVVHGKHRQVRLVRVREGLGTTVGLNRRQDGDPRGGLGWDFSSGAMERT